MEEGGHDLTAEELAESALLMSDGEWQEVASRMDGLTKDRLVRLLDEGLGRGLLAGPVALPEQVEGALVRLADLACLRMRTGGEYQSLAAARAAGVYPETGGGTEDVALEQSLLTALFSFFERWWSGEPFHGRRIPTSVIYGLLSKICSAVGPQGRRTVLLPALEALAKRVGDAEVASWVEACIEDFELRPHA